MHRYSHLSIAGCEDIMYMRYEERGVNEIARAIGRDNSMVSRELDRAAAL